MVRGFVTPNTYVSTNASDTVATTSFGGTQDAGTQIQVTPQITDGDQVLLDYTVSISTFVGTASDPALPPPRQETQLKSTATVPDGFVIAVGGLSIETQGKNRSQVPLLGDIPILGELFGTRSIDTSDTRFYVFLRGTVMRAEGFEDLKYVSQRALDEAELDDGWPRLEPRVMR
jgi:general secretion pathway protein D